MIRAPEEPRNGFRTTGRGTRGPSLDVRPAWSPRRGVRRPVEDAGRAPIPRKRAHREPASTEGGRDWRDRARPEERLSLLLLAVGIALVVGGAELFDGIVAAAQRLGVSAFVLTVLLSGLELENLVAGIAANAKGLPDAAAGSFLGGATFLALGVAGAAALIAPIRPGLRRRVHPHRRGAAAPARRRARRHDLAARRQPARRGRSSHSWRSRARGARGRSFRPPGRGTGSRGCWRASGS